MEIDVRQILKDYKGREITEPETNDDGTPKFDDNNKRIMRPLSLRELIAAALMRNDQNKLPTLEEQAKVHMLELKLYATNKPKFTSKEKTMIEERVARIGNSMYTGRVLEIFGDLESESTEKEAVKEEQKKEAN